MGQEQDKKQLAVAAKNVQTYLEARKPALQAALPRHLDINRVTQLAMTAMRRTPKLLECSVPSLYGAIMQCAQLGLEVGVNAHLVPFWNNKAKRMDVQFIADYRGLIDIARRSGDIGAFYAYAVKQGDEFEFELGLRPGLRHRPGERRGEITHFYAVAVAKDESWSQFEVMTKQDVDAVRARSKAAESGPWVTDYEAMGRKTVARRLCKWLPYSVELQRAVELDEAADRGDQADLASVFDGEFIIEEEDEQQGQGALEQKGGEPGGQQATGRTAEVIEKANAKTGQKRAAKPPAQEPPPAEKAQAERQEWLDSPPGTPAPEGVTQNRASGNESLMGDLITVIRDAANVAALQDAEAKVEQAFTARAMTEPAYKALRNSIEQRYKALASAAAAAPQGNGDMFSEEELEEDPFK